jgi:stearoyl-CoA desaturase (delta-9 desaturase)
LLPNRYADGSQLRLNDWLASNLQLFLLLDRLVSLITLPSKALRTGVVMSKELVLSVYAEVVPQIAEAQPSIAAEVATTLPAPSETNLLPSIRWDYTIFFVSVHLLALLALHPWFFSWVGIAGFVVGVMVFGQLAIPIGYHRLLSHRSFRTPKWFERALVTLAMCTAQETPGHWVAWHRMHHCHSDHHEDPHSPRKGFFWAHVKWLVHEKRSRLATFGMYEKYARDILADPYYRWIERLPSPTGLFFLTHAILLAIVSTVACVSIYGNNLAAYQLSASLFLWSVVLRTVWVWHITWSVNSLTHLFGYRNYQTTDDSRNNWFVSLLTAGEGWHNNHHADPASASVQHRWWEIDVNYYVIRLFGAVGLATHIVKPRHQRTRKKP